METKATQNEAIILKLPSAVINQIAAGEVVERPASIIKELVENSLDAQCQKVEIHIKAGGCGEIVILDDGAGMTPQNLQKCLERHTTSKISQTEDLWELQSFGFRGEALASIASVSKVEIRSRAQNTTKAHQIRCDFGEESPLSPVSGPVGTRVTVSELFGNTPARKKFLRSPSTELSHCTKLLKSLALGAPSVGFLYSHEGKTSLKFLPGTREQRFLNGYRPKWEPMKVHETQEGMELEAFLSPPHQIQNRGDLYFFVNGRGVKNRSLFAAIRSAFLDTLGPHHEPSGVVYLDLRPDWVDVNVHPQKWEVRCLGQEKIFQWIRAVLRKAISQSRAPRPYFPETNDAVSPALDPTAITSQIRSNVSSYRPSPTQRTASLPPLEQTPRPEQQEMGSSFSNAPDINLDRLRYVGQIKASYLVCEDKNGIVFVDQHALHEKLEFERLKLKYRSAAVETQKLLVPKILTLPSDLLPVFHQHRNRLEGLGFDLEPYGEDDIAVKGIPVSIDDKDIDSFLLDVLDAIRDENLTTEDAMDRYLRPVLATIACHSVVRANQPLAREKAESLISEIHEIKEGWNCPHGRPVLFRLTFPSLEKHFERG